MYATPTLTVVLSIGQRPCSVNGPILKRWGAVFLWLHSHLNTNLRQNYAIIGKLIGMEKLPLREPSRSEGMRSAEQVVEQEFLQVRAKILEIAAFLDRLDPVDSGSISETTEARLKLLRAGCELLLDSDGNKAARVQLLFSRTFDEQWRKAMGV